MASLTGDREGNLWIGTNGGGVTKLTERSFSTLSKEEGLSSVIARTVLEGRDGTHLDRHAGRRAESRERRPRRLRVYDARRPSRRHGDGAARARGRQRLDRDGGRTGASAAGPRLGRSARSLPVGLHQGALRGTGRCVVGRHERRGAQDSPGRPRHRLERQDRPVRCRPLVLRRSERHGLGRERRGTEPLRQRPLRNLRGRAGRLPEGRHDDQRRPRWHDLGRHVRRRTLQIQGRNIHALLHGQRPVRRQRVSDRRRPAGQSVDDVQPRCLPGQQTDAARPCRAARERDHVGVVRGSRRDAGPPSATATRSPRGFGRTMARSGSRPSRASCRYARTR